VPSLSVPPAVADPVEDMSITLLAGRVVSSAPGVQQAVDAERLGFGRVWMPERYTNKEVGVLLGAMGARTERIGLGAGPMSIGSRLPIVTAAIGATMQSVFGSRCTLGLGRGAAPHWYQGHGFGQVGYQEIVDLARMMKSLWAGEVVNYNGPAGRFEGLSMADPLDGPAPKITFFHMGGKKASQVAADPVFDHIGLVNMTRPEVTRQSVDWSRAAAERIGRDPDSLYVISSVTTAPDLDEQQTMIEVAVRVLVYLSFDILGDALVRLNQWEESKVREIRNLPVLSRTTAGTLDQTLTRTELVEAARIIPERWCRDAAAMGPVADCVRHLERYREAGASEINLYGSTPAENAGLIQAWRERSESRS
jgi:5,10-methylenetetrahydromethanopterin reductase